MAATGAGFRAAFREAALIEWLQALGHDAVAFRAYPHTSPKPDDTGLIRHFPTDGPVPYDQLSTSQALIDAVLRDKPDVVVIRGADYAMCHTAAAALPVSTPVILIAGGEGQHPAINGRIDYLLCEYAGQSDVALFPRLKGWAVFPKFVNWTALKDAEAESKTYDIVNIGTFEPRKNQAALIPLGEKYRLCFVGEGEKRPEVEEMAKGFSAGAFTFTGECAGVDVYRHIARSRLMVHPSTYEGFPRVFAESLASGVPVVAFKTTFPRLEPPPGVILIEPDSLVPAVEHLLSTDCGVIGHAGKAYAESTFRDDNIFSLFLEAMETCCRRRDGWGFSLRRNFWKLFSS